MVRNNDLKTDVSAHLCSQLAVDGAALLSLRVEVRGVVCIRLHKDCGRKHKQVEKIVFVLHL